MSVRSALCALLVFVFAAPAQAQSPLPPDSTAPGSIQAGPVALTPAFEITNAGVDSNVFNDADGPQEDFTATLRPRLDARLRFGPQALNLQHAQHVRRRLARPDDVPIDLGGDVAR